MKRKPSARMLIALKLLSGSPHGGTEHFFSVVHGIDRKTLDAMVAAGLASVITERLKQGFVVARFHITEAGRHALAAAPLQPKGKL
jgi:DNA-binding PadR family transcriptional regulator